MNEKILFWHAGGMLSLTHLETSIALALKLRGYDVHMIICDGVKSACVLRDVTNNIPIRDWSESCNTCDNSIRNFVESLGISVSGMGDYISQETMNEIRRISANFSLEQTDRFIHKNINMGTTIKSSLYRYLMGYPMDGHEEIIPEFTKATLITFEAAAKAYEVHKPTHVFMSHAMYSDWGGAFKLAVKYNLNISIYMASYQKAFFYFNRVRSDFPDFRGVRPELWEEIKHRPLDCDQKCRINSFFQNRYHQGGSYDMGQIFKKIDSDVAAFKEKYQINSKRPVWTLFTHMNWDAVSETAPMIYSDFDTWLLDTIEIMKKITDVQWLIKIHPVEVEFNNQTGAYALIKNTYDYLPDHIKVVPPEESILPNDLYGIIDGGITVYGTAGFELTHWGKPVILAGKVYYGQKGFTYDACNRDEYVALLTRASTIGPLSEEQRELADKLIYTQFIQMPIPLAIIEDPDPDQKYPLFQDHLADTLNPGEDPHIDLICDAMMNNNDFILSDQMVSKLYPIETGAEIDPAQNCVQSGEINCTKVLMQKSVVNPFDENKLNNIFSTQTKISKSVYHKYERLYLPK